MSEIPLFTSFIILKRPLYLMKDCLFHKQIKINTCSADSG